MKNINELFNSERAKCASEAVKAYAMAKINNGTDIWDFESEHPQEAMVDLLTDLRHWAYRAGLDFESADSIGRDHFDWELHDEKAGEP
ncbi:MAG: hypothetical protein HZA50_13845 [Planctomycetes bacterium]|nr:hypothetical protein [Planctomycetota bacterium]